MRRLILVMILWFCGCAAPAQQTASTEPEPTETPREPLLDPDAEICLEPPPEVPDPEPCEDEGI